MKKIVFISYHFNDKTYKGEIQKWLQEAGVQVISTDENDLRPEGAEAIRSKIREQIAGSALVLILVGNDTHNRPWVDYEVAVAKSKQVPAYWIRLSNRSGAPPVEVRSLNAVEYLKSEVMRLLRQLGLIG